MHIRETASLTPSGRWRLISLLPICLMGDAGAADEIELMKKELEDLRGRIEHLEVAPTEVHDDEGHKLHPVHSAYGARIAGGLTATAQGPVNNPRRFGGDNAEGASSADLYVELPVQNHGLFLLRLDAQQGAGLTRLPPLFVGPNDNPTGPNSDVESWNGSELHVAEARYEQRWGGAAAVVLGHIDLTAYFDNNEFANSETTQYLAQQFVNNVAVEWGGNDNFFGPGAILIMHPTRRVEASMAWFEGDGDYTNMFQAPFLIGQLTLETGEEARESHYRLYAWTRRTSHCRSAVDPAVFADCARIDAAEQVRVKEDNSGLGLSVDKKISPAWGVWARAGYQDPNVAQFDRSVSVGAVKAGACGRAFDRMGLAYGATLPSTSYKEATGRRGTEHYLELYYKYVVHGDGETKGLHVTPDLQVIAHPAGDEAADGVVVPGLRVQVHF